MLRISRKPIKMHFPASDREHNLTLSRRLYVLAWTIEGIAVFLGLGMALTLNMPGESSWGGFLLGAGGFVMVACAELSKIPLATFFVQTKSWRAKLATLAFLILMSFITFETIFMSLERGFNARMIAVRVQAEKIFGLKAERGEISAVLENPAADIKARREAREQELAEHRAGRKLETSTSTTRRKELEERRVSGQSGSSRRRSEKT